MRVIAGAAKGHKLATVEGLETRPTTDRIKETLFNIIAFDLPECHFLDLFAGSGAIGIEALSRGAAEAVFVDASAECRAVILENLRHTKLEQRGVCLQMDVLAALEQLAAEGKTFDLIYLDPPYASAWYTPVLEKIVALGLLRQEGYLIAEGAAQHPILPPAGMKCLREKVYKTTILTFLCLEEEAV